jgi:ribonuclease III
MPDIDALQDKLGVRFGDPSLLEQALVHSSYINENPARASGHNERLEFLGDAVLGLFVAEKLYREFPGLSEGEMTQLRAALVRRDTLARLARAIGLGEYLYLGRGEEASGGRHRTANLAGALEAVVAAVYLDRGAGPAEEAVGRLLGEEWEAAARRDAGVDYKSKLQEVTQSRFQQTPQYQSVAEEGPDHARLFTVQVTAGDKVLGTGSGRSKKLAETEAARAALEKLEGNFTKQA